MATWARTAYFEVRMTRKISLLLIAAIAFATPSLVRAAAPTPHIVVVVFDGLRPDTVNPTDTPALYALAQRGTFFAHHHPVYPSSTEVNGAALSTGSYPQHDGLMGNMEYRPSIELLKPINTENQPAVRLGDKLTGGLYLRMPTLAEILQSRGLRTVVAGTKPVALLLDRRDRDDSASSPLVYAGHSLPATLSTTLSPAADFPKKPANAQKSPNLIQDAWTTRVLTSRLWNPDLPAFTMLWLSEPDFAQHGSGPNSAVAKAALRSSDDNLALVLKTLADKNALDSTDLFVVSDHGFSTISHGIFLPDILNAHGFHAAEEFKAAPQPNDIVVVNNGGSICLYVIGHDPDTTQRLAAFLQTQPFAGVLFSQQNLPGSFPLSEAHINTPQPPDLVLALKWSPALSPTGLPGLIYSEVAPPSPDHPAKIGNHASLSPYDMHNTLIAAGPDIRPHFTDSLPSGNIDLAPTILSLLHVSPTTPMDGRILSEALTNGTPSTDTPTTSRATATITLPTGTWTQYLQTTTFGHSTYIDQGASTFTPNDQ
jgi:arylsulfatase A-like enzyme